MAKKKAGPKRKPAVKSLPSTVFHKDGSLWAKGQTLNDQPIGYWEWFRKDGTKLRSGYFDCGEPIGEWTTYDARGEVYKVTIKKPKLPKPPGKV